MLTRWLWTVLSCCSSRHIRSHKKLISSPTPASPAFKRRCGRPKISGSFHKYGFNGDVVLVPGSVRQIQAVLGGSIHLAQIDAATGINAINQGADLVMISGTLNYFPYSFVTQKEIRKPEDLTGKKIGILAVGGATETATFLALKAWNIARQSVTIFPAGDSAARIVALSAKAIDGTMLSYPDINEALRLGMHELAKMRDVKGTSFPMNVMVARRSFVEKNRDTVKRFQQAYAEGTYQFMTSQKKDSRCSPSACDLKIPRGSKKPTITLPKALRCPPAYRRKACATPWKSSRSEIRP